jgi:carboxymethylenebutenolidase
MPNPCTVRTPDGDADAVFARPDDDASHPGVILMMDAFGLRPAFHDIVDRVAAMGYVVLAPNLFHRSSPSPVVEDVHSLMSGDRAALFAALGPMMDELTPDAARRDIAACLAWLREEGGTSGPVGIAGYCMGGRIALRAAAEFGEDVAAVATFHGGNLATDADDSPHLGLPRVTAQVYVGHADNDHSMSPAQAGRLSEALMDAHVDHACELYVGAAHGWTQSDTPAWNEAASERHFTRLEELFARALR